MSKRPPKRPHPRSTTLSTDPAHAPGKRHIARDFGSAAIHTIDRHQQQQRTHGGAQSIRNRRTERGR
jgi:hypothetical protein